MSRSGFGRESLFWSGPAGEQKMIADQRQSFDQDSDMLDQRTQDEVNLIEQEISDFSQWNGSKDKILEKIQELCRIPGLDENTLKKIVPTYYGIVCKMIYEEHEDAGGRMEAEGGARKTVIEYSQKIYEITGIPPSDKFSRVDFGSIDNLREFCFSPELFVFSRDRNNPATLDKISDKTSRNEFIRMMLRGEYDATQLTEVLRSFLLDTSKISVRDRVFIFNELKSALPEEAGFQLSDKEVEGLYTEAVEDKVREVENRGWLEYSYGVGTDQILMKCFSQLRIVCGKSSQDISFPESLTQGWYQRIIPLWVRQVESADHFSGLNCGLCTSIKEITGSSPDLSRYSDIFKGKCQSLVDSFARDFASGQLDTYRVRDAYDRLDDLCGFPGLNVEKQRTQVADIGEKFLGREMSELIENIPERVDNDDFGRLIRLSDLSERIQREIPRDPTKVKESFVKFVKRTKNTYVYGGEVNNLLEQLYFLRGVFGSPLADVSLDSVGEIFDYFIVKVSTENLSSNFVQLEDVFGVSRFFSDRARIDFLERTAMYGVSDNDEEELRENFRFVCGESLETDVQSIYFKKAQESRDTREWVRSISTLFRLTRVLPDQSFVSRALDNPQYLNFDGEHLERSGDDSEITGKLYEEISKNPWVLFIQEYGNQGNQEKFFYAIKALQESKLISFSNSGDIARSQAFLRQRSRDFDSPGNTGVDETNTETGEYPPEVLEEMNRVFDRACVVFDVREKIPQFSDFDLSQLDQINSMGFSNADIGQFVGNNTQLISRILQPNKGQLVELVTLREVFQAVRQGKDLRLALLCPDRGLFLREATSDDQEKDPVRIVTRQWTEKMRKSVSIKEVAFCCESLEDLDYVERFAGYTEWRSSFASDSFWNATFREAPKEKFELEFRMLLSEQEAGVQDWYEQAAEYVGNKTIQTFILRFYSVDKGRSLHDALFWIGSLKKLTPEEAKSCVSGIDRLNEVHELRDYLSRYSRERDTLAGKKKILSLAELQKRVKAIEIGLDLNSFSEEIAKIFSAPAFDTTFFVWLSKQTKFKELAEGKMDTEQPFKPHKRLFSSRPLGESLREGLGSRRDEIKGTALNPKELFRRLTELIKGRKIGEKDMEVSDLLEAVPVDLEEKILVLLRQQRVNVGQVVEAEVHAKSDPRGWVCGNYTDCCMKLGNTFTLGGKQHSPNDGKNLDGYMFNPSTQYFTISLDGRTVAQSVVVDSLNKTNGESVVVLDNIEIADNFKGLAPLLSQVYRTFWTEYTERPVKIGTGYSDLTPVDSTLEVNSYQPKTPLTYSDSTGPNVYGLKKIEGVESLDSVLTFANITDRDVKIIAEMEKKIYPDGMVQGDKNVRDILQKQRELEVPGAASSFILRQGEKPVGYLLMLPEKSEIDGRMAAHVHDMAILPGSQGKGLARKMIQRVLDAARIYGASIEAEARKSTSYAVLMNEGVRKWIESQGFVLSENKKMDEYLGGEDFYFVRFENRNVAT